MQCRYCKGKRVEWRRPAGSAAYTICLDCRRRNTEERRGALPHGMNECARAQMTLNV